MAFFTNSAIHMYAHGSWAEVLMLAGGAELGLVRGRLRSPLWRLTWPLAFVVTGTAFIVHEQNPWFFARSAFLHHLLGWTFVVAAIFPLLLVWRPRSAAAPGLLRADDRHRVGDAVLRPRRGADLRPSVVARRNAAPMRRWLPIVLAALAFPAAASAHATLQSTTPRFGTELQRSPGVIRLHFDQSVKILPGQIQVLNGVGRNFAYGAHAVGTDAVASVRPLKLGAYTVRWQAVSADSHVVSGVWTFGVRVPAPSVNDAYGAGGPTDIEHFVRWLWFLGIALDDRRARPAADRPARARRAARARPQDRRRGRPRRRAHPAGGDRGLLAPRRGRAAAALRQVPLR